jgi:hypothetical protein
MEAHNGGSQWRLKMEPWRRPCCRSDLNTDSIRSVDPDPDQGGQKSHKNRKKLRNFMFWSAGCSLFRAEGFSCTLDVLYGGLGISKWIWIRIQWIRIRNTAWRALCGCRFASLWWGAIWIRIKVRSRFQFRIKVKRWFRIRIKNYADQRFCFSDTQNCAKWAENTFCSTLK